MWQFFSHIVRFLYFFFLTFNGSIFTLCGFNITCDSSFFILGGSLIFFSHLTVSSSYCTVSTSHVTVLLSHLVVLLLLLFSHLTITSSYCAVSISHVTVFSHSCVFIVVSKVGNRVTTQLAKHAKNPIQRLLTILKFSINTWIETTGPVWNSHQSRLLHQVLCFLGISIRSTCTEVSQMIVRHGYKHPN